MSKNTKIKFNDPNVTGTQVPDGFITVGGTDSYKLLEAFNIDWKNINIPWVKSISKWNGAGVSPNDPDYENTIEQKVADADNNVATNNVDWLDPGYDYLGENGFIVNGNVDIPDWAKNGTISGSEDIIDIINYLTWRVAAIDHFTNNWDSRQSKTSTPLIVDALVISNGNTNYTSFLNGLDTDYLIANINDNRLLVHKLNLQNANTSEIWGTLIPKVNRTSINDTLNLSDISGSIINIHPLIISPSNGKILANSDNNNSCISIVITNNGEYTGDFATTSGTWYYYDININIKAIDSNYHYANGENGYLTGFLNGDYTNFDKSETNVTKDTDNNSIWAAHSFRQQQSAGLTERYGEEFIKIPYHISKTNNSFGNNQIIRISYRQAQDKIVYLRESNYNENNLFISKYYKDPNNSSNVDITMPYAVGFNEYDDYYDIIIDNIQGGNLKYGQEYGIKPHFFVKNSTGNIISSEDPEHSNRIIYNISGNTSGYIELVHQDDDPDKPIEHCYFHPCTEMDYDNDITICCLLYYDDIDLIRTINPLYFEFDVKLTASIKNYIIFADTTSIANRWNNFEHKWQGISGIGHSPSLLATTYKDAIHQVNTNGSTTNYIPYLVSTITYDDFLESASTGKNLLVFDHLIKTHCANASWEGSGIGKNDPHNVQVSLIGIINSIPDVNVKNWDGILNDKYKLENDVLVGTLNNTTSNNTFYYYDGDNIGSLPTSITDNITSAILGDDDDELQPGETPQEISLDIDLHDNNVANTIKEYINGTISDDAKQETSNYEFALPYNIKYSTAIYQNDNGLIRDNNEWHDADNEYYYLVFKVKSPKYRNDSFSYTGCKAYIFLRILRASSNFAITFKSDEINQKQAISYNIKNDNNNYSIRVQPRQMIFLNRILSEQTKIELDNHEGTQYWYIGVESDGGTTLDESVIAISNKISGDTNFGEEFIKIFNVGDHYPKTQYSIPTAGKINSNTYVEYENVNAIVKAWADITEYNSNINNYGVVGAVDSEDINVDTRSGAILFINKLMFANENNQHEITGFSKLDASNGINLNLMLTIGNCKKYKRKGSKVINNPHTTLQIFPTEYDFELCEDRQVAQLGGIYKSNTSISNKYEIPLSDALIYDNDDNYTFKSINAITSNNQLYITSNAFSNSTEQNIDVYQDVDKMEVLSGVKPYMSITDDYGYSFDAVVDVLKADEEGLSDWYVTKNNNNESIYNKSSNYTDALGNSNQPAILIYPEVFNSGLNTDDKKYRAFLIYPQRAISNSKFYIEILNDPYGIYNTKTFELIYSVTDTNSSADVEQG